MRRGDLVLGVMHGDYGKPRPYVLVQRDLLFEDFESVLACPTSSDPRGYSFRLPLPADARTGLAKPSEVMVDKVAPVPKHRLRRRIGACSAEQMQAIDARLAFVLGLRG